VTPAEPAEPIAWRVRYQQLRMPLVAMQWAIYPGLALLAVLYFALIAPCDVTTFRQWCLTAAATWLVIALHARFWLHRARDPASAQRLMAQLKLLYAVEGAVWGYLPWVTLDSCSPIEISMTTATIAGVVASRMMLLSSVPGVFLVYIAVCGTVWVAKALAFDALPFHSLGIIGALYVLTLVFQARVHARMLERSIRLRFENEELLEDRNVQMALVEAARREAETANAAKSRFLAAASHDLRQPAHAQGLYLDLLGQTALDTRQRDLLDNVRAMAGASADMLDTLLDYSRIEAGAIDPRLQDFPLQPLLNRIEREFGPQADARGLVYRTRDTDLTVHSDPKLVELILRNLVANAIRYTRAGGLLVACRRRGDHVELAVWDTGIGIPADRQADVFQEFLQLGNPERDRRKGFGLGLAIVAGLAQRLDHRLTLHSRPGRGSVFGIALPPAGNLPAADAPAKDRDAEPPERARLLVIDDDPAVRDGMCRLLSSWGYVCAAAEGIADALALARMQPPDAVIADYRLRGNQTGNEAIAALRTQVGTLLPALLITGDTSPERMREARASGVPVLHKPLQPDVLRREVARLLRPPSP
jgi:signal transduction histidine kinase/CheY-like chemotaxis protein